MAKMNAVEKFFVNRRVQYYLHQWFWFGRFLRKLSPASYGAILEIGTGVGFTAELLARKYPDARITATDFDEDSIALAKRDRRLENVVFAQEDATHLTFPKDHFDAVFSVLTLHHIEHFQAAIAELARVVKPDGRVYIMDVPTSSFNFVHLRRSIVPGIFSKKDLMKLLEDNGLSAKDYGGRWIFCLEGRKKQHYSPIQ